MKRNYLILVALLPMLLNAGVIMKKSGERLEDVTIKTVTDEEILYEQEGTETTIEKSEVSAILYDDGRYEEVKQSSSSSAAQNEQNYSSVSIGNGDVTEYNVYAFGNYIKIYYVTDHKHDGATVEYRIIYKGQSEEPEWNYLGTAPFAYTTATGGINPMISADAQNIAEPNPLIVENPKKMKKVEFRLSQEGYKTVVTSPLVQIDVTGLYYFISLNKLKPLKAGETNEEQPIKIKEAASTQEQKTTNEKSKKQNKDASNRLIPQICYTEGKKAYDATYKEGQAQAIKKGYSKSQAILIAGEFAEQAKKRAIDECYETIVERDEELSPKAGGYANPSVSLFSLYELSASGKAIIPQACTEEGKKAYETVYAEAEAKAVRQGYSKSQAKTVAADAAEKAKKKAIDECYDNVINKGQDYYSAEDNTVSRNAEVRNQKAETERIIPQACLIEGERIYTKALKEAQEIALKQGYSKDQAKTIAPEIAEKAKAKAIDDCYNRVVVLGEDFFSETGEDEEDKPVVQGPVSLGLSEKSKQIIPQACYTEGKKAYDNTYEKTHAKALRQGYSKSQAAKIASETAQKAQQAAIDDYYDIIVIKGEYYPTETVQKDDKTSPKAKASKVTQESTSQDPTLQYTSEPKTVESEPTEEYYQPQNNKVYKGEESLGIQKRGIEFRASKSFIEFTETGGETRIEIISDEAWEVAEMPSWVDTRQKGDVLIINVAQNELTSNREGDIVLLNKHQTELRIVVAQGRNNDYLKLSAQGIDDTEGVGGAYTIKVNSNKAWDAKTDADWCTIEKREENFVVRLASNMSGQKREATIEVTASQSVIAKQVFWVKQSPLNHYIFISPSSVTSKGKKGIITINVTTDMPKYRIEDVPDWCSISQMKANSFILEIADNSGGAAREAQIKVAVDGGKSKILTVQQEELMNYVSVSPKIITASPRGGIITIHVEGSGAWRVVNLPDWCQTTEQTNDSFTLIIEKNDTDAPRNASFSVSVNGVREQIEVRQQ